MSAALVQLISDSRTEGLTHSSLVSKYYGDVNQLTSVPASLSDDPFVHIKPLFVCLLIHYQET